MPEQKQLDSLTEKVDHLEDALEEHMEETRDCFQKMQEESMRLETVVADNTAAVRELAQSVSPVVAVHNDFIGAARVGKRIKDFGIWLLIVSGTYGAITYIIDKVFK